MTAEFSGIERRLDELSERLARLEPLRDRTRTDFDRAPYLRDISVDWDHVYHFLGNLADLERFAELVRHWLQQSSGSALGRSVHVDP